MAKVLTLLSSRELGQGSHKSKVGERRGEHQILLLHVVLAKCVIMAFQ